jgi:hypothetical protein
MVSKNHAGHMKFNININQIVLSQTKLDIIDGAILDYLYYLCSSLSERVQKQRKNGYTWVNFSYLMDEMPLLRIRSKSRISERIKKISKEGYLETMREGNKFYIKLTSKMDELFVKTNTIIILIIIILKRTLTLEKSQIYQTRKEGSWNTI